MSISAIEVRAWGQQVGAVAFDPNLGCYAFSYAPAWIKTGVELAPLTMPLAQAQKGRVFAFPSLSKDCYHGLPGLLADALPDDFGNALIDAWMASKGVSKQSITTLDRLAYMGRRGMGALEFRPARGSHHESQASLSMKSLVEAARLVVRGDFSDDNHAQAALANVIRVGTSAGGARAKAVVAWNPVSNEIRSGQFEMADGFESWLLKFDGLENDRLGAGLPFGRTEYAYALMAEAAGIEVPPRRLLEENGRAHFMVRRFDRDHNRKHHIQTLCAMAHLDYKQRATHAYEQFFLAVAELDLGAEALQQAFLRMAFNVMARNCDDHTKNFAFRLRQGASWELTPAYDITYAHNPDGEWTYQHLMSVNGKFDGIEKDDLLVVAERFSVPRAHELLAQVHTALLDWPRFAQAAGLAEQDARQISQHHRLLPP